ncbi:MAG: P-loop NTPase [Proteobacteria bacterium]|nr:P-loop NTPase [Pseudomonadota bacterium]
MKRKFPVPRIIAVAGGKGGVGKSTIAVNLAHAIGRLGLRVTIIDADLGAANLHTMMGVLHPTTSLADFLDQGIETLDAVTIPVAPMVGLVAGTSRPGAANISHAEKLRLIRAIGRVEADCVIVDIGAGIATTVIDIMAMADHKLIVMTPQLTSLHNAYALLKACVHRTIRKLSDDEVQQLLVDAALGGDSKARTIPQLLDVVRPMDPGFAERIVDTLAHLGVSIVGNQIASKDEAAAISRMAPLIQDHLQITAPMIATIQRAPALAGSLRVGSGTVAGRADESRYAFSRLAQALVTTDLAKLRGFDRTQTQPIPMWLAHQYEARFAKS